MLNEQRKLFPLLVYSVHLTTYAFTRRQLKQDAELLKTNKQTKPKTKKPTNQQNLF